MNKLLEQKQLLANSKKFQLVYEMETGQYLKNIQKFVLTGLVMTQTSFIWR